MQFLKCEKQTERSVYSHGKKKRTNIHSISLESRQSEFINSKTELGKEELLGGTNFS